MKSKITKIWLANEESIFLIQGKNYLILIGWDVLSCQLEQNIIHNKDSLINSYSSLHKICIIY